MFRGRPAGFRQKWEHRQPLPVKPVSHGSGVDGFIHLAPPRFFADVLCVKPFSGHLPSLPAAVALCPRACGTAVHDRLSLKRKLRQRLQETRLVITSFSCATICFLWTQQREQWVSKKGRSLFESGGESTFPEHAC